MKVVLIISNDSSHVCEVVNIVSQIVRRRNENRRVTTTSQL